MVKTKELPTNGIQLLQSLNEVLPSNNEGTDVIPFLFYAYRFFIKDFSCCRHRITGVSLIAATTFTNVIDVPCLCTLSLLKTKAALIMWVLAMVVLQECY